MTWKEVFILKWGIISAANIAFDEFVPALRRSKHSRAYAIASHSPEKMQRFHIATRYSSYEDILDDPEVDAVYIALPNAHHHQMIVLALEAGKHVLVEKPATTNLNSMREVNVIARRAKKVFLEGYMYQYHKQHQLVKEYLPLIGEIKQIKAHFSYEQQGDEDFRLQAELGGGAMYDVGGYCLHVITQIIGFQPKKISLISNTLNEEKVDLTSVCTMIDEKGVTASFVCSMELPFSDSYEAIGLFGRIRVTHSFRPDLAPGKKGIVEVFDSKGLLIEKQEIEDDQYLHQIEYFEELLHDSEKRKIQLKQSLDMAYYMDVAYQSAKQKGRLLNVSGVHSM